MKFSQPTTFRRRRSRTRHALLLLLGAAALLAPALPAAAAIFMEDFSNPVGGAQDNTQFETNLLLKVNNTYTGWTGSGTYHVVDLDALGNGNWAAMFWLTHSITSSAFAGNTSGEEYVVSYNAGPGVYAVGTQQTGSAERLLFEVLDASNAVIDSSTYDPEDWGVSTAPGFLPLTAASFNYTGNGNGDARLRISGVTNALRFNGTVDDIMVDLAPEPSSAALLLVTAMAALTYRRRR